MAADLQRELAQASSTLEDQRGLLQKVSCLCDIPWTMLMGYPLDNALTISSPHGQVPMAHS